MKKFFGEFKKFISRGNVIDLAVGVIIGGAFSAIVTALTNQILMPLINWVLTLCLGKGGLEGAVTMLSPAYTVVAETGEQVLDLANSIYIDWGAFISAILNFVLIAFVLFLIIKAINYANGEMAKIKSSPLSRAEIRQLRKEGKTVAEIVQIDNERRAQQAEEKRLAEEEAKANAPKTEQELLAEILATLQKSAPEQAETEE